MCFAVFGSSAVKYLCVTVSDNATIYVGEGMADAFNTVQKCLKLSGFLLVHVEKENLQRISDFLREFSTFPCFLEHPVGRFCFISE